MENIEKRRIINLGFTLVGRSRDFPVSQLPPEWKNADSLEHVKDRVALYFGARAVHVVNEERLASNSKAYPEYYAAQWFCSADAPLTELVIIDHGSSMESAQLSLQRSISDVPWDMVCVSVAS